MLGRLSYVVAQSLTRQHENGKDIGPKKKKKPEFQFDKKCKVSFFFHNGLYKSIVEKASYIAKLPI